MKIVFFAHFSGFNIYVRDLQSPLIDIFEENLSTKIDFSIIAAKNHNILCSKTISSKDGFKHFVSIYSRILEVGATPRSSNIGVGLLSEHKIEVTSDMLRALSLLKEKFIDRVSENGIKLKPNLIQETKKIIDEIILNNRVYLSVFSTNGTKVSSPNPTFADKTKAIVDIQSGLQLGEAIEVQQKQFAEAYFIEDIYHQDYERKFNLPSMIVGSIRDGRFLAKEEKKPKTVFQPLPSIKEPQDNHSPFSSAQYENSYEEETEKSEILSSKLFRWKLLAFVLILANFLLLFMALYFMVKLKKQDNKEEQQNIEAASEEKLYSMQQEIFTLKEEKEKLKEQYNTTVIENDSLKEENKRLKANVVERTSSPKEEKNKEKKEEKKEKKTPKSS